jgi:hypothetical protein
METRENLMFHTSPKRSLCRLAAKLAVAACAALVATLATTTSPARASTVPYHQYYQADCTGRIYPPVGRPYELIKVRPKQIDEQQIGGYQDQWIYLWLWVWVYTPNGWQWQHSPAKRVLDGWPASYRMEAWDRQAGAWMSSALGDFYNPFDLSHTTDLLVGAWEEAFAVPAGNGPTTWTYTVEIYWAPPFTVWPLPTDPTIPSGGLPSYDRNSNGTYLTVTCP